MERTAGDLAATAKHHDLAKSDLDKVRRHASNLEGEVGTLRRRYQLAERILADVRQDPSIRRRMQLRSKAEKYGVKLPKLAYLWGVNLFGNAYIEWWQRRKGVQIFPGMKKIDNGPSPR
ncbi:MAG: hypothetical protein M5R36_29850 [Deltaproteobacteria bacterium]|nr:hypothetical protein [Deltaproteobacteria bacterium]